MQLLVRFSLLSSGGTLTSGFQAKTLQIPFCDFPLPLFHERPALFRSVVNLYLKHRKAGQYSVAAFLAAPSSENWVLKCPSTTIAYPLAGAMSARCIFLGCGSWMRSVGFLIIWFFTVQLLFREFAKGHSLLRSAKGIDPGSYIGHLVFYLL